MNTKALFGNKRIVLALGMIVFVAAVVAGGTGAFFSDTETSTGNTFTAGAIDLRIDSQQHYNGNDCVPVYEDNQLAGYEWEGSAPYPVPGTECNGTWDLTDLTDEFVAVHKFFDFDDVKPGDYGENTISLHVDTNDAYLCAALQNVGNEDLGLTEPESIAVGEDGLVGEGYGELQNVLQFFAWVDEGSQPGFQGNDEEEGDNVFQEGERELGSAYASELGDTVWALAQGGDDPVVAGQTAYIGLAWCVGYFDENGVCHGENVGNASQTDSWYTDMAFYVEQARNNPEFSCDGVFEPEQPQDNQQG